MMKRYAVFVLLIGVLNQIIAEDSLKVMTYNLEGMKPGTDPQTRIFHAIQYLKQLDPDIIGVQEINETPAATGSDNQAKAIADSLAAHFHMAYYVYMGFTHLSWDNQFNEYVGIISKYPVEKKGYFDLVKGAFPRKVLWNQINTHMGAVNFFNTHLDHLTASVRVQQVQQIMSYIEERDTTSPAIASILTGDFNDEPNTTTILSLTNAGTFIDSYHSANPSSPGYTVPSNSPSRRIDYIFYKNNGELNITKSIVVMNTPYTGSSYPSDHLGVMTIFKKNITSVGDNTSHQNLENFELLQNYPNPFNPATTISYYLPQLQHVTLKIYNSLGQKIRTLVSETQTAGIKSAVWNGRDDHFLEVASGMYMVQLSGNGLTKMRKVLLLK